jgi:hypothetical protein
MKTRFYAIIAVAALASSSMASAQSFTWTSKASPPSTSVGGVAPDGKPFGAQVTASTAEGIINGQVVKNSSKCISMTQPANAQVFNVHMMCDTADSDGTYTSYWGCTILGPTEHSCIGGMLGLTGAYAKRSGTITGHIKGTTATGTGQWNN